MAFNEGLQKRIDKMKPPESLADNENILNEAKKVKRLMNTEGYRIIEKYWLMFHNNAFMNLIDENIKEEINPFKSRQRVYNSVTELLAIPSMIIKKAESAALALSNEAKVRSNKNIKGGK